MKSDIKCSKFKHKRTKEKGTSKEWKDGKMSPRKKIEKEEEEKGLTMNIDGFVRGHRAFGSVG